MRAVCVTTDSIKSFMKVINNHFIINYREFALCRELASIINYQKTARPDSEGLNAVVIIKLQIHACVCVCVCVRACTAARTCLSINTASQKECIIIKTINTVKHQM